ncbi:Zn(II)2Cys6 transcription factor [Aspergillus alliaceus]|uniref:Zn(II)2Cys6 transcription factor n=1 Tax=Petromyces alliaceus TaxID=209559 RepID=UPI0012A4B9A0|nr:fungal-specific transcription factor domain-containing protein [Aspergillus alliaceus]KAB8228759.1 fungal-specific transcription factor domain-containing protein [Aspergillus alliaceus]
MSSSARASNRKKKAALDSTNAKESTGRAGPKAHHRSRSGCFTCRLRRKKCDEIRPICDSCSTHALKCEYRPPQWWATNEKKRGQRERIKGRIRQTKVMEKNGCLQEYIDKIKTLCEESPASEFDPSRSVLPEPNPFATPAQNGLSRELAAIPGALIGQAIEPRPAPPVHLTTPVIPYDINFGVGQQMFLNNNPLQSNLGLSDFSAMSLAQPQMPTAPLASTDCFANTYSPMQPFNLIDSQGGPAYSNQSLSTYLQMMMPVDEKDRHLLENFLDNMMMLIFPIVDAHQVGPARIREIFGLMQNNRAYFHCCLSFGAIHLKSSLGMDDQMDHDIMQHRYDAISHLCRLLSKRSGYMQVIDATLAFILFHCSLGTPDDYLPDVPWTSHFQGVAHLVKNLNYAPSQFNVTLIAWIDIIAATMAGSTPHFSHTYRAKHLGGHTSGLQQLMGCDDRVMYLISEIACLESLRVDGLIDDMTVLSHVSALTGQIDWTEPADPRLEVPFTSSGVVIPEKLTKIITSLYRISARLYLYSLLPSVDYNDPAITIWLATMIEILKYIPAGSSGFDRCLVWPLFIAGASAAPSSNFRKVLTERIAALGYLGELGSFGRMYRVLKEVWRESGGPVPSIGDDDAPHDPEVPSNTSGVIITWRLEDSSQKPEQSPPPPVGRQIHWRDVMKRNNWNFLLM